MIDLSNRHPATRQVMQYFSYDHLPPHLQAISQACYELAEEMLININDNNELTIGLRKLLEAKDCFVRARLAVPQISPEVIHGETSA